MRADRKADMEEMEARLEDDRQAEQRFLKELMQMMDTGHKKIMAEIKPEKRRRPAKRRRRVKKRESRPQWT
jgi:hypothetical protein